MAVALKDEDIELRGGAVKTKVRQAGNGPPVVFLHGLDTGSWNQFFDDLAASFTVYAPLHPGLSDPDSIRNIDNLWDLVLYHYELFDTLGLRDPAVIGHSFGGMVAAEVAATNQERVSKLVLIDSLGLWRDDYPMKDPLGMPRDSVTEATFFDAEGEVALSLTTAPEDPDAKNDYLIQDTWAKACTSKFTWPIPDKGLKYRIHRIVAPTLVIWGKNDGLTDPVYAQEFSDKIENASVQVEVIDQAGNYPHLEQREKVVGLISSFLKG